MRVALVGAELEEHLAPRCLHAAVTKRMLRATARAAAAALLLGATCDDAPTHAAAAPRAQRPCTEAEQSRVQAEVDQVLGPRVTSIVARAGPFGVDRVQAKLALNHVGVTARIDLDLPAAKRAHGVELEAVLRSVLVPGVSSVDCAVWLAVGPPPPFDAGASPPPPTPFLETTAAPPEPDEPRAAAPAPGPAKAPPKQKKPRKNAASGK